MTRANQIGMMAWRIGDLLDIHEQFNWIEDVGFDGVGFHAHVGTPGQWRGIGPDTCGPAERKRLRERLAVFTFVEIHAPFADTLTPDVTMPVVARLEPVLAFAGDVGATVVTVHAIPPAPDQVGAPWADALDRLDALAATRDLFVGLEVTEGFATIRDQGSPRIGVTLDVGHMYCHGRRPLQQFGTIGAVGRELGPTLKHLHLHDVLGERDHVEIGTGQVEFDDLFAALRDQGFAGGACLELNPDAVTPDGMRRSLESVRSRW